MNIIKCTECGNYYLEKNNKCLNCGSIKKTIFINCKTGLNINTKLIAMKAKKPHLTGKKKIIWEWENKETVRGDNGNPVKRYKLIDRENDKYEEVLTDLTTGEIFHECKEPLSKHQGHGSAKKNY